MIGAGPGTGKGQSGAHDGERGNIQQSTLERTRTVSNNDEEGCEADGYPEAAEENEDHGDQNDDENSSQAPRRLTWLQSSRYLEDSDMPEKATDPLSHSGSNPNQIYPLDSSHRVEKSPAPAGM